MKLLLATLAFAGIVGRIAAEEAPGTRPAERNLHPLFTIERSLNRNQVIYEARSTPKGFNTEDPIKVYWKMLEKGDFTEGLSSFENARAYGVTVLQASTDRVQFSVKALPERPISVLWETGTVQQAVAYIKVAEQNVRLTRIYIRTGKGLVPKVIALEIHGLTADGQNVSETITPR